MLDIHATDLYLPYNVMKHLANNPATQTKTGSLLATGRYSTQPFGFAGQKGASQCSGVNPVSHLQGFGVDAALLSGWDSCAFDSSLVATNPTNRAFGPVVAHGVNPTFHESGRVPCALGVFTRGQRSAPSLFGGVPMTFAAVLALAYGLGWFLASLIPVKPSRIKGVK
jgi:hypothetical protein